MRRRTVPSAAGHMPTEQAEVEAGAVGTARAGA